MGSARIARLVFLSAGDTRFGLKLVRHRHRHRGAVLLQRQGEQAAEDQQTGAYRVGQLQAVNDVGRGGGDVGALEGRTGGRDQQSQADRTANPLREITQLFGLTPGNVLFVDDVARVAEAAKYLDAPFVGHPSAAPHSHQAAGMRELGLKHVVHSLADIDDDLIGAIDREAAAGTLWATPAANLGRSG